MGREGEREGEKHQCVVASCVPPTGDLACSSGKCSDWESSQRPPGSQAGTLSIEPYQSRLNAIYLLQNLGFYLLKVSFTQGIVFIIQLIYMCIENQSYS